MELQQLKRKLPYRWRVQSINDFNAVCVAYIDSRDVQDLLDEVCGAENWQSDYKEVKGNVYAGVAIKTGSEWVWKWDCGVESKTEAEKGEASDSFKRAAVKWGVGRFLYSLEIVKLKTGKYKDKNYPSKSNGDILFNGDDLTDYINSLSTPTKTTLYNHREAGTDEKPIIPNEVFKEICDALKKGDESKLNTLKDKYTLVDDQKKLINQLYIKHIKK